uniref:peptide-methionine (S)-S-oxide reductase n=1 Tax=Aquila chrysaetos chrysaetos TaxID=223781 RepID=A0A663EVF0_AQUCH
MPPASPSSPPPQPWAGSPWPKHPQPAARSLPVPPTGMGCFWGAEQLFWKMPGVFSTQVGYVGVYTGNEGAAGLTGHAEVVRVIFNPWKLSYKELLKVFWEIHDPTQGRDELPGLGSGHGSSCSPGAAPESRSGGLNLKWGPTGGPWHLHPLVLDAAGGSQRLPSLTPSAGRLPPHPSSAAMPCPLCLSFPIHG